jgi:hypothetical protein
MNRLYFSYAEAESDCDMIAGDNELHMAVVECFDLESPGESFAGIVVSIGDAWRYVEEHGHAAEIIYNADHTPETKAQ